MFCTQQTRIWVGVTRYNMLTWTERERWRSKHMNTNEAIYPTPCIVTPKIPQLAWIVVIEMNNDTNSIEGIGILQNTIWKMRIPIFSDNNYNRYSYRAKYYKSCRSMTEKQQKVIANLEKVLFKGKTHLKRGYGITKMSYKLYQKHRIQFDEFFINLCDELNVFKKE